MRLDLPLVLGSALAGPVATLATLDPRPGEPVLAVFWPWQDAEGRVRAADGRVIGPVRAPMAVLATGDAPDFADRLNAQGALAVLDGTAIALLCNNEGISP